MIITQPKIMSQNYFCNIFENDPLRDAKINYKKV